ncbi:hypothetical protein EVAR_6727_1 [Eumeta japonica]|uniref:Uncharacterized protein n=1 Tax=Eumeta variegata TaxID=151549 RepID=A0A4C1V470_EUMVA|nr:hypothetical protein EVAR_6727_1 [Eumeta japonica]
MRGKRAGEPSESTQSPPPIGTRNPGVTGALQTSRLGKEYLTERRLIEVNGSQKLSFTGRNPTAEADTLPVEPAPLLF